MPVLFMYIYSGNHCIFLKFCSMLLGFGGVLWLELIGGMLLAVHRVLLRMALVRMLMAFIDIL